ncbi:enoyl-CoA hydratase/isomerase family protein [Hellea sp.]|nr:enoyl-CoA hydratase/isomerase family protein [Hellea sp.]
MTNEIKSQVVGNLGHITLNRPKALNALTYAMCEEITRLLVAWEKDSNIGAVLIDGEGERAFCAGGDVILLHDSGKAGDSRAEEFWRIEYALNELIHRYSKPYITLIDGFVMGGGVGLSVHGRLRVAGNATMFAMPETGIGYFPDVGGTYFLPRLGMEFGQWLGLTGARLDAGQSCHVGVANAYVPSAQHGELIDALGAAKLDGSDAAVANVMIDFVKTPPASALIPRAVKAFGEKTVPAILRTLDEDGSEWAQKQAISIRRKSPLAMCVTFEALRRGAKMNFREVMTQELDISLNFLKTQDFYEGIRAQLIDKDRKPKWSHDDLSGVTEPQVQRLFRKTAKPPQEFL